MTRMYLMMKLHPLHEPADAYNLASCSAVWEISKQMQGAKIYRLAQLLHASIWVFGPEMFKGRLGLDTVTRIVMQPKDRGSIQPVSGPNGRKA